MSSSAGVFWSGAILLFCFSAILVSVLYIAISKGGTTCLPASSSFHEVSRGPASVNVSDECEGGATVPQLGFTTSHKTSTVRVEWPVEHGPWEILEGEKRTMIIHVFCERPLEDPMKLARTSVLAWFRRVDQNVVFAVQAVPQSPQNTTYSKRVLTFTCMDPGIYDVFVVELSPYGKGYSHLHTRQAAGSPFRLHVKVRGAALSTRGVDLQHMQNLSIIRTPQRFCALGSDEEVGRWVRCCQKHGARIFPCTRDGWVFMPNHCQLQVFEPRQVLQDLRQSLGSKKVLWIVFAGSSTLRGTMHALVDSFIDQKESFFEAPAQRGVGTATKCWGWFDVRVGNLRLSYQDMRSNQYDRLGKVPAVQRLWQLAREGPDLIVLEMGPNALVDFIDSGRNDMKKFLSVWKGTLVMIPRKFCWLPGEPDTTPAVKYLRTLVSNDSDSIMPEVSRRVLFWDENSMARGFIFDNESPLDSGLKLSPHWHRYGHSGRRHVFGAVVEMSGQIFLAQLLQSWDQSGSSRVPSDTDACPLEVCADCPEKYTGLNGTTWRPPQVSPKHTLADRLTQACDDSMTDLTQENCISVPTS